ncbi:MAG: phenylalanine 4-monooxygenase [Reyranella sp.]|jgi:phenylalanine-4-hydroxylase|uniref:phenylalanine 4-monooxygenase n=1 Tax=Reyranella sp. TaxID=1929291 RepID=UPI0025D7DC8F|nr:phenylalanine 4-monooxygenase [Reyranella sp.]MBR2815164.1 phenylalanine 4-monooxygenase [Reyranella sp.]
MNMAPLDSLRGDYAGMAPDWTVTQTPDLYSDEEQAVWRLLLERQSALARRYACAEFLQGLETLGIGETIPDFAAVNAKLEPLTGWRVVAVPGLIPDAAFYDHLAHRRFPVTVWIRKREELDYLVEPDLFHDFFGHVPLLTDPVFADYMQEYGRRGVEAGPNVHLLARLYWFTVEFGLIRTAQGLKVYGAGIVSSAAEIRHAIEGEGVERLPFDAATVMHRPYEIDRLQNTYFVLDDFRQLFDAAQTRIA